MMEFMMEVMFGKIDERKIDEQEGCQPQKSERLRIKKWDPIVWIPKMS